MNINEFTAKKIGEVIAFTRLGNDTISRSHNALVQKLGEDKVQDMIDKNSLYEQEFTRISTDGAGIDITLAKAEKTFEKLSKMRDLYVGDEWDNATEILEWSGFFEGAFIVHLALVKGCAETLGHEDFITLTNEAITYHYETLELVESELSSVGQDKASN
jgi:hypothetical protein